MKTTCAVIILFILLALFALSLIFSLLDVLWVTTGDENANFERIFLEVPRSYGFLASSIFLSSAGILFTCMFGFLCSAINLLFSAIIKITLIDVLLEILNYYFLSFYNISIVSFSYASTYPLYGCFFSTKRGNKYKKRL